MQPGLARTRRALRVVKDVAAGAVLVSSIGAALIGAFTFLPYVAQSR